MTEHIVTSSVLILIVITLRYFFKGKINQRLQYALWALVLVRLLVPINFAQSPVSVLNAVETSANVREEWTSGSISSPVTEVSSAPEEKVNAFSPDTVAPAVPENLTDVHNAAFDWTVLLYYIWYTGIGIVGLSLLISNLSFSEKLKKTRKAYQTDACKLPVYVLDALSSPCLFGFFRPSIYITQEVAGDETKLRYVLAHELTHYRHCDYIWSVLCGLSLAIHWYNPLVWLAAVLSRRDSETACDEGTIKCIGETNRIEYGRILIGLTCGKRKAIDLLCCTTTMNGGKKGIRERITLIAQKPKILLPALITVVLVMAVAVGCTFTGAKKKAESTSLTDTEASAIPVKSEVKGRIPQAVLDYGVEYVSIQVDHYNKLGDDPPSGNGGYAITDAKIIGLTQISTGTAEQTSGVNMYLLEYRLHPDHLDNVVLSDSMQMGKIDSEGWITEWGSAGQPYLLLAWDDSGTKTTWQRICDINTAAIEQDYGTPEMLELYGNEFTAAAVELYQKYLETQTINLGIQTIGQVPTVYTRLQEHGVTDIHEIAELLLTKLLDDLKTGQDGRTYTITEWKDLSVSADRTYDAWVVTGKVDVRYKGTLSPIGDSDNDNQGEFVSVSLGERQLKNENSVYTLSLSPGESQLILSEPPDIDKETIAAIGVIPESAVLEPPLLKREMDASFDVIPDYVDDERLIFHGYFGLFVYDLKSEKITFSADLEKAVGTSLTQGDERVGVNVSADGNTILLHYYGDPIMAYTVDSRTGDYDYDWYAPLKINGTVSEETYNNFHFDTLGELTYTYSNKSYLLFSDWDWAN